VNVIQESRLASISRDPSRTSESNDYKTDDASYPRDSADNARLARQGCVRMGDKRIENMRASFALIKGAFSQRRRYVADLEGFT